MTEPKSAQAPDATERPPCLLCGCNDPGTEVGTKGRFGMDVRNVACPCCALVFQTPRPSPEVMAEYYGSAYREHYGAVRYPTPDGKMAGPGEPGYDVALETWHRSQATNALALGAPKAGDAVLEVGCRHARTLSIMKELRGIDPYGVEPGEEEAREARDAGVPCFTGTLEDYDPGDLRFQQIQMFHVLEHIHDPVAALVALHRWLAPGGRLVLEVPNVYQPYGLLEENFFQNAHLTNLSPVTLPAMLARAGYETRQVIDEGVLIVVGTPDKNADASDLPLPFTPSMLSDPTHDAQWVAERLGTYAALEKLRLVLSQSGVSMDLVTKLSQTLRRPGFVPHTAAVVSDMTEHFMRLGAPRIAMVIAGAAANGPYPTEVRAGFAKLASTVAAHVYAPAG